MKNWLLALGVCFGFWILILGFAPAGAMGGPAPTKPAAAPAATRYALLRECQGLVYRGWIFYERY